MLSHFIRIRWTDKIGRKKCVEVEYCTKRCDGWGKFMCTMESDTFLDSMITFMCVKNNVMYPETRFTTLKMPTLWFIR